MANYYDIMKAYKPSLHYVDFVRCLWCISYHRVLQWALRITKKSYKLFHPEDPFWVVSPMPKYDQKSIFDRKVLESPILNQNDCNRNFKIFLMSGVILP